MHTSFGHYGVFADISGYGLDELTLSESYRLRRTVVSTLNEYGHDGQSERCR